MIGPLFWKTWGSLWVVLMLTYVLSGFINAQLQALDARQAAMERPWRIVESLAIEAERFADRGGDLRVWSRLPETNALGEVYLLDDQGNDINGAALPTAINQANLQPFTRYGSDNVDPSGRRGFARTVFVADRSNPLTLIFIPREAPLLWSERLPTTAVLFIVGLLLTAAGAWLFSRHLVLPVRALFMASNRLSQGDFSSRPGSLFSDRRDELAQLAKHFDVLSEKLGKASEFQQTLLRDVSHELRSPLTRLQVACELIRQPDSAQADILLQRMQKECGELENLIDEILALARFDHSPRNLERHTQDLVPLLREVARDADFTAQPACKTVVFDSSLQQAPAEIDSKLLKRALSNIINNALQYSPAESRVQICLMQKPDADRQAGPLWRIRIADQGPGVPEADLQAIFRPFYRADNSRGQPGHGIGLAMVARIISAHGGCISASNLPRGGLAMDIQLPGAQAA